MSNYLEGAGGGAESSEPRTIELARFGECTYAPAEVIEFPWGLPGFADLRRFLVISHAGHEAYLWLQSLDDPRVALPICDPWSLFDDYEVTLPQYARQSLRIETAESFCVLCVLIGSGGQPTTINLLAPVIINLERRIGRQITLENSRYSVRTALPTVREPVKEVVLR